MNHQGQGKLQIKQCWCRVTWEHCLKHNLYPVCFLSPKSMEVRIKDLDITEGIGSAPSIEGCLSLFCTLWIWASVPGLEVHPPRQRKRAQNAYTSVKRKDFPIPHMNHHDSGASLNVWWTEKQLALFLFCSNEILKEERIKSKTLDFGKTVGVMLLLNLMFGKYVPTTKPTTGQRKHSALFPKMVKQKQYRMSFISEPGCCGLATSDWSWKWNTGFLPYWLKYIWTLKHGAAAASLQSPLPQMNKKKKRLWTMALESPLGVQSYNSINHKP